MSGGQLSGGQLSGGNCPVPVKFLHTIKLPNLIGRDTIEYSKLNNIQN